MEININRGENYIMRVRTQDLVKLLLNPKLKLMDYGKFNLKIILLT